MKKFLKWGAIVVGVLVLVVGGFLAFVALSGMPTYDTQKVDLVVERTPEHVARGRQLAVQLCMMCHMDGTTKRLSGIKLADLPEEFGVAYSKNITQHKERGIGKWTDGDIAFLLRTGIHPHTGSYVPPWMPKFPHMSDSDIHSIIAWLRSDDPALAPDDKQNVESEPSFFAKFLSRVAFKPFDYPTSAIPSVDTSNRVEYGKYLTTAVYDCYQCHSADFASNNPAAPSESAGFFAGGIQMPDLAGNLINCPNITHDNTGIGNWTEEQFVQTMRDGIRPDGTVLRYPMARLHSLSDYALGSMYSYLKTVPKIKNNVDRTTVNPTSGTKAEKLFASYGCSGCHGNSGNGIASLLLADAKYPDDSVLVDVIRDQVRYNPDSFMPKFASTIPDDHLAVLSDHVRALCRAK